MLVMYVHVVVPCRKNILCGVMYVFVPGKKKSVGRNLIYDLGQCLCHCVFIKVEVIVIGSRILVCVFL